MTISHGNVDEAHTPQNLSVHTLSSYVVAAGSDKILVISSSASQNSGTFGVPTATFDGNAMTLILNPQRTQFGEPAMFYYLLGDTTPTGDIVVTWSRNCNLGWGIHALTLIDAKQQGPEVSASSKTTTGNPIDTDITTLTANAYIIDMVRSDKSFTNISINGHVDQTEIDDVANDANNRHATSFLAATTAALYELAWTQAANDDKQHIVTAWEAAGGGAVIPFILFDPHRDMRRRR